MKSKNMRVAMLLVPNIVCVAPTDCQAGELLCSIQHEQNKLPHVTANQVMQNVFKNYNNLNIEVKKYIKHNLEQRCRQFVVAKDFTMS